MEKTNPKTFRLLQMIFLALASAIAVCAISLASASPAFADSDDILAVTDDEISTLSTSDDNIGLPDDSTSTDVVRTSYSATGKDFNKLMAGKITIPENRKNVFTLTRETTIPDYVSWCLMVETDLGLYFIADTEDSKNYETDLQFFCLDEKTYLENTLYYSPTTLADLIHTSYEGTDPDELYNNFQLVTEGNIDTIPFPDPSAASADEPVRMMISIYVWEGALLPADPTPPLDSNKMHSKAANALFLADPATTNIDYPMVEGYLYNRNGNLYKAGPFSVHMEVPGDPEETSYYVQGRSRATSSTATYYAPVNAQLRATSFLDLGEYVSLKAALVNRATDATTPMTNVEYYRSSIGCYTSWYFNAPNANYNIIVTDVAPYPGEYGFVDVEAGRWFAEGVESAFELGYVHGTNAWYFDPTNEITRGQIASILFNMSGWTESDYNVGGEPGSVTPSFPDVAEGAYYYKPVEWAVANDVIYGYNTASGPSFGPNDDATREQFMTMIYRYANLLQGEEFTPLTPAEVNAELAKYPDGSSVSSWARDAVAWCVANEIVYGNNRPNAAPILSPKDAISRAEVAVIAGRLQPEAQTQPLGE